MFQFRGIYAVQGNKRRGTPRQSLIDFRAASGAGRLCVTRRAGIAKHRREKTIKRRTLGNRYTHASIRVSVKSNRRCTRLGETNVSVAMKTKTGATPLSLSRLIIVKYLWLISARSVSTLENMECERRKNSGSNRELRLTRVTKKVSQSHFYRAPCFNSPRTTSNNIIVSSIKKQLLDNIGTYYRLV